MGILQERIKKLIVFRDTELDNLDKYPLRSKQRNAFIRKIDDTRKAHIVKHKKKVFEEWKITPFICECGFVTTNQNLRQHKQSKSHLKSLETAPEEATNNKVVCQCGGKYTETNKSHHEKTKQHLKFIGCI